MKRKGIFFGLFVLILSIFCAMLIGCSPRQEPVVRTIMFQTDGGTAIAQKANEVKEFPVSEKEDYLIEGWYRDSSKHTRVSFPFTATEDTTLYAAWVRIADGNVGIQYEETEGGYIAARFYDPSYSVCIPDTHAFKPVLGVKEGFFGTRMYVHRIYLGKNVRNVQEELYRCLNLTAFTVHPDNEVYTVQNGSLYNRKNREIEAVPRKTSGTFSFDCNLSENALSYNNLITTVEMGENASAPARAFSDMNALEAINVNAANRTFSSENGILYSKDRSILYKYPQNRNESEFTLPDSTQTILEEAFSSNESLRKIRIGRGLSDFDDFSAIPNLEEITVSEENASYSSANGVLYNKDKTILCRFPCAKKGAFDMEETVETIDSYAFAYASGVTEVILPKRLKKISAYAFLGCLGLQTILSEEESELEEIETAAFALCTSLTKLTVTTRRPPRAAAVGMLDSVAEGFQLVIPSNAMEIYENAWAFAKRYLSASGPALTTYTVTFISGDGSAIEPVHGVYIAKEPVPTPNKEGFVFAGWYDNEAFLGKKVAFPYIIEDHVLLYADYAEVFD